MSSYIPFDIQSDDIILSQIVNLSNGLKKAIWSIQIGSPCLRVAPVPPCDWPNS